MFKKALAMVLATTMLFAVAAPASAKDPTTPNHVYVQLFRESLPAASKSRSEGWWVDKATSFIPVKNLKWNATVIDISSPSFFSVSKKAYGQYVLEINAAKSIRPGKVGTAKFYIKQNGDYFKQTVKVHFVAAATPFTSIVFGMKRTEDNSDKDSANLANEFTGRRTITWRRPGYVNNFVQIKEIKCAAGQAYGGAVITYLDGRTEGVVVGNWYDFSKIAQIKITYRTTAAPLYNSVSGYTTTTGKKFFKESDIAPRFPVAKYAVIKIG